MSISERFCFVCRCLRFSLNFSLIIITDFWGYLSSLSLLFFALVGVCGVIGIVVAVVVVVVCVCALSLSLYLSL